MTLDEAKERLGACVRETVPTTCVACGCKQPAGGACPTCGRGQPQPDPVPEAPLPPARNPEERATIFRQVLTYVRDSGDVEGAVRALATGTMIVGSPLARALGGA